MNQDKAADYLRTIRNDPPFGILMRGNDDDIIKFFIDNHLVDIIDDNMYLTAQGEEWLQEQTA